MRYNTRAEKQPGPRRASPASGREAGAGSFWIILVDKARLAVIKRLLIGLAIVLSLPFVAVAVAVGYLLFSEWRERLRNPPPPA